MKIIYWSFSTLPSQTANSVHVMKMSGALSNLGQKVTLITGTPVRITNNDTNVFKYYDVEDHFEL